MKQDVQNIDKQNSEIEQVEVVTQLDGVIEENTGEEALDAEGLNAIEPAAGEENSQNADSVLEETNFQTEAPEIESTGALDAVGALEETELEYGVESDLFFNEPDLFAAPQADAVQAQPEIVIPTPPVTNPPVNNPSLELFNTDIRVSNQTDNQRFINDADHYELVADVIGKNHKLFGDEMDIGGVADDVLVRYKFKAEDSFRAVLKSDWNALKNIDIESDELNTVVLKNFVHADVDLGGDADKNVRIVDAKRGFIETDGGDDRIVVKALTNGSGWSNTFEIDSGDGDDFIKVKGDQGHTIAEIDAGAGDDVVKMRGEYEYSDVYLGEGNDRFQRGMGDDTVFGGAGNDVLKGGKGHDVLYGGEAALAQASIAAIDVDFEFVQSIASFRNTVGFYEVGENGEIENVHLVFENLKALDAGDTQSFSFDGEGVNYDSFIIANGHRLNGNYDGFDFEGGSLSFIYNYGQEDARVANIADAADAVSLVYTDGEIETVLDGNVFHEAQGLNRDDFDHAIETDVEGGVQIAFEDLFNGGDMDFTDAVFNVYESTRFDVAYAQIGSDDDILRGGQGNDVLVGGLGDDVVRGGADIDIAVFMGSVDEYIITQNGNRFTVEDTVAGRDGVDIVKGVEGLLFGIEDLYLDILGGWDAAQIDAEFDVQSADDLDLTDLLEGFSPLQDVIDSFVHVAQQGSPASEAFDGEVAALAILTTEDALSNSYDVIA